MSEEAFIKRGEISKIGSWKDGTSDAKKPSKYSVKQQLYILAIYNTYRVYRRGTKSRTY